MNRTKGLFCRHGAYYTIAHPDFSGFVICDCSNPLLHKAIDLDPCAASCFDAQEDEIP